MVVRIIRSLAFMCICCMLCNFGWGLNDDDRTYMSLKMGVDEINERLWAMKNRGTCIFFPGEKENLGAKCGFINTKLNELSVSLSVDGVDRLKQSISSIRAEMARIDRRSRWSAFSGVFLDSQDGSSSGKNYFDVVQARVESACDMDLHGWTPKDEFERSEQDKYGYYWLPLFNVILKVNWNDWERLKKIMFADQQCWRIGTDDLWFVPFYSSIVIDGTTITDTGIIERYEKSGETTDFGEKRLMLDAMREYLTEQKSKLVEFGWNKKGYGGFGTIRRVKSNAVDMWRGLDAKYVCAKLFNENYYEGWLDEKKNLSKFICNQENMRVMGKKTGDGMDCTNGDGVFMYHSAFRIFVWVPKDMSSFWSLFPTWCANRCGGSIKEALKMFQDGSPSYASILLFNGQRGGWDDVHGEPYVSARDLWSFVGRCDEEMRKHVMAMDPEFFDSLQHS